MLLRHYNVSIVRNVTIQDAIADIKSSRGNAKAFYPNRGQEKNYVNSPNNIFFNIFLLQLNSLYNYLSFDMLHDTYK